MSPEKTGPNWGSNQDFLVASQTLLPLGYYNYGSLVLVQSPVGSSFFRTHNDSADVVSSVLTLS